jgi:hypothetical protein
MGPGDGAPEADDYESPGNGGVSRRLVAAGVAAIVLVVGLVALLAGRSTGDGSVDTAGSSRRDEPTTTETTDPPPTTAPTTTTVAPQTTGTAAPGSSSTGSTGTTASGPTADPSPVDPPPGGDPTTEDPPPPAAPAPEIVRFAATETAAGTACARGERTVSLVWTTEEATSATLAGPGAPTGDQPATGRATACAPPGQATYTLTATGPGGTAESTATSGTPPAG